MKNHQITKTQYFLDQEISFRYLKIIFFKKKIFFKNNLKFFKFFNFIKFSYFFKFLMFKKIKIFNYFISSYKNNSLKKINNNDSFFKNFFCKNYVFFLKNINIDLQLFYKNINYNELKVCYNKVFFKKNLEFFIEYIKLFIFLSF